MKPLHTVTPVWESRPLSGILGAPVFLKMEALQPVGSFKIRGVGHACRLGVEAGTRHLVCASGGNAGYAAAYAGRVLGVNATVVVPETTPEWMRETIRREGAEVVAVGDSWDESHAFALDLADRKSGVYIHPFDDPRVWEGHASMVAEMAETGLKPGAVVVSVGGGGLMCGLLRGMRRAGWADVPVVAVETQGTASLSAAVSAGRVVTLERIDSVATTLGARAVTPEALAWTRRHPVTPWTVSDRAAVTACLRFADDHRVLVEPSCGAALSAVYDRAHPLSGKNPVLVIVCGGAGVSLGLLKTWCERLGIAHA